MTIEKILEKLEVNDFKLLFSELYGEAVYEKQKDRYINLINKFSGKFPSSDITIISSPGRTELGGNHTDHNHGRVLAASIQLDTLAAVSQTANNLINVFSEGFSDSFFLDLASIDQPQQNEHSTTSLIRGIVSIFQSKGLKVGGFNAYVTSDVLIGSGLSSSASFEILIGKILSVLFNNDEVDAVSLAKIGQEAENDFLDKPCGLMDQVACSYGGIVAIDFKDPTSPYIEPINYSFKEKGYQLLVIDTGGDHSDLTEDYSAIPAEMKSVAQFFGHDVCRSINKADFLKKIPELVNLVGDRAVLRALHFLNEDERVVEMVDQLNKNDFNSYLKTVQLSGNSSFQLLQNVFTCRHFSEQKMSLAIALTGTFNDFKGAVRVHGGGFAGTVQVYVEMSEYERFKTYMEQFFGPQSVTPLRIRKKGSMVIV
jgi:galactokinase